MSISSDSDSWDTAGDRSDTDSIQTASDEGEEEDDSGDLSHLGAEATSVKFQTVQQQSYQVIEEGIERLAQQVLQSCELSNQQLVPTSGEQTLEESRDNSIVGDTRVLQQNYIQVQQQFGDVTVQGTRNLTIGGTQNIGKPGQCQDEHEKALTEKIRKKTLCKMEDWNKGMVRTSALQKVLEKVNKGTSWVTIKGSPGEGKTTVAYMALEEIHKMGRQVFQVSSPKEFSQVTATCSLPVVMLDDIFGNLEFDQAKWLLWEEVLHDVIDPKEHRSLEEKSKKFVTVILVGREYVLNSASCNMGRMADFFTQDEHVVFMTSTVERDVQEKHAIWKAVSDSSGIELDQKTIDKICRIRVPHGFPHVCRLFVTIRTKSPDINVEKFFKTPLELLTQTLVKFMHNNVKLALFKELLKGDGKVSVRELGKLDSGSEIIQTAYDLVGTYLRKEDDYFVFDHPSIYDSVAYNFCKLYPLFVIDNCNLSFIHERVRIQPSGDTQHDTPSRESDLVVYIPRSYVRDLAKRFVDEISKLNLLQVFSHKQFRDEIFTREVMSVLQPLTKLTTQADCKSGDNFLSVLVSNKSSLSLKYVHNHIGRQLTKDEINTVLFGVCKYAASDVLAYLTQISGTLDINVRYGDKKQTPLMIAAETRDSPFVQDILSLDPDVNACDWSDTTAFHYLCKNGLVSPVTQVIDRVSDINMKNNVGLSPLFYACSRNHLEVVKLLLDRGAMLDGKAVEEACRRGSVEIVSLLFERGATLNMTSECGETPLHSACIVGNMKVIRYLIDKGASVNVQGGLSRWSPLHVACLHSQSQAVQYLLDHAAVMESRNIMGDTPLHKAAERGSKECADVLLKAGADLNVQSKYGYTPLHKAAGKGSKECVVVLLKAGADVNVKSEIGYTPLHKASDSGSKDCVDRLLKAGADVNVKRENGYTPLHTATERGSKECVDVLMKAGADVNAKCENGYTPLHTAAEKGAKECFDVLLKAGADVNVQNKYGQTLLHTVVYNRPYSYISHINLPDISVCQTLIRNRSDINTQDTEGNTPLHQLCCVYNDTEIYKDRYYQPASSHEDVYRTLVTLLIDHGADVNIHNNRGEPALRGWCQTLVRRNQIKTKKNIKKKKSCTLC